MNARVITATAAGASRPRLVMFGQNEPGSEDKGFYDTLFSGSAEDLHVQEFLGVVHLLASERRLSRFAYVVRC